jgi:DNA-directed RNA polymerase specialized sigma24 family protein
VNNILTQGGFDKLLETLDANREQAGAKYESLRRRLVKFFEWRNAEMPEELADTVLDRLIKKLSEGEQVQNINAYSTSIAQLVFKEDYRRKGRLDQTIDDNPQVERLIATTVLAEPEETANSRFDCLEKCLAKFPEENQRLVTAYYDTDERTMIAARKRLADSLDISLNTLRIRVCRLKAKLEDCTVDCCAKSIEVA